ncbi:MAG: cob(I)yrinic acid a,c-diamide adenosyltransferase, partial [Gammaproteobacteria bacterium]
MNKQNKSVDTAHKKKMEKLKKNIDATIKSANIEKGIGILLTGNGKGKSSSAFGMVIR